MYRLGLVKKRLTAVVPLPLSFDWTVGPGGLPRVRDSQGEEIVLASPARYGLYRRGVVRRYEELVDQYGLQQFLTPDCAVFVDVGANIGEFGKAIQWEGLSSRYIAFEPDPLAFTALSKNNPDAANLNIALADYTGRSKLFLASATADSSLHQPTTQHQGWADVRVDTLDNSLNSFGLEEISILKVEAEGGEPEVLAGAAKTLRRTRVCVVDAGPELHGTSTAPGCISILANAGFELVDLRFPRGILVFQNTSFNTRSSPSRLRNLTTNGG